MSNAAVADKAPEPNSSDVVELPTPAAEPEKRIVRAASPNAQKAMNVLDVLGLGFINPFIRLAYGEDPRAQFKQLLLVLVTPILAIIVFLMAWSAGANSIETRLGKIPGPVAVAEQAGALWTDHKGIMVEKKEFETKYAAKNKERVAAGKSPIKFTGKETFIQQIWLSIKTVFLGFFIATVIAVPVGVFCGMNKWFNSAMNPLIQVFKPVSPLAWLPIVTLVISALYAGESLFGLAPATLEGLGFTQPLVISALVVTLCSLWATLINTAHGVSSIDKDLLNVAQVLKLKPMEKVTKIILPSSLPLIFTGLRLSLGVGWMVLIAAEMLAQNPGLGKFVWDEFQNGSSTSLARILVAVLTIGIIGFLLDRLMYTLQAVFTFSDKR